MKLRSGRLGWLALDLVLVAVFALVGRLSHGEAASVTGMISTAWPFAAGCLVGWLLVGLSATRTSTDWDPVRPVPAGLPVWLCTVIGGLLLRPATGSTDQLAFVIVATVTLAVFLLGWRLVAVIVRRRVGAQSRTG